MGSVSLRASVVKVILVILVMLFLDSPGSLARSINPSHQTEVTRILERKDFGSGAHPSRLLSKGLPGPRTGRGMSNLAVSSSQGNGTAEANALLEFREEVTHDPFGILSSWNRNNVSNYCKWPGVRCSSPGGPVSALDLSGHQLGGTMSSSLGGLKFISLLDLSDNSFGGLIPSSIGNCSDLTVLNISVNELRGSIPAEFSTLVKLAQLDLSRNQLTGVLPPPLSNLSALTLLNLETNVIKGDLLSIAWGGFAQLHYLNLSYNQFLGSIPESLSNCTSLVNLDLSSNELTYLTDIFGGLQKLENFDVSYNYDLAGSVPQSISSLKALRTLYMQYNVLTGGIPASIVNCSSMAQLVLPQNSLTGEIPPDLGLLSELVYFDLWNNSFTGHIPVSLLNCSHMEQIILSDNDLGGQIPTGIGTLSNMTIFEVGDNNLVGEIPVSLSNWSELYVIQLTNNLMTGSIPSQLGLLQGLQKLHIDYNSFSGLPPSFENLTALNDLVVSSNPLSGQIPRWIGKLAKLQVIELSDCLISGRIPSELSNCTQLYSLDLSSNLLADSFPNVLGTLKNLNYLYLNRNNFTGSISSALATRSEALIDLSLAYNSFTGIIDGNGFSSLHNLQGSLDLSHNFISGPLSLVIGSLQFVQEINLSFNAFSGVITPAFSRCLALESLDLSSNNLDGEIPDSLSSLQYLAFLNVSFNQLVGSIPEAGPFVNFTNQSFLGNPHLCGPVVSQNCSTSCSGIRCHRIEIIIPAAVTAGVLATLALAAVWFALTPKTRSRVASCFCNGSNLKSSFKDVSVAERLAALNGLNGKFSEAIVLKTIADPTGENVIGRGAKSIVYKGILPGGEVFAIKSLSISEPGDAETIDETNVRGIVGDGVLSGNTNDLLKEAEMLAKLRHKNIVKVLSLYLTPDYKALILEYMSGGSLHQHLHDTEPCLLTWQIRLNIAVGVAEAIKYLHHDFPEPLIHRDLKTSNILLDEDFEPKVADFGISKFVTAPGGDGEASASTLCGTVGYMPPEYGSQSWVSTKGDVFSYGIVIMELLTRRPAWSRNAAEDQGRDLRGWVLDHFNERPLDLLDDSLVSECSEDSIAKEQMRLLLKISIFCTSMEPQTRPSMIDVVGMLTNVDNIRLKPVKWKTMEELAADEEYFTFE